MRSFILTCSYLVLLFVACSGDDDPGKETADGDRAPVSNVVRDEFPPCEHGSLILEPLVCELPLDARNGYLEGEQMLLQGFSKDSGISSDEVTQVFASVDLSSGEVSMLNASDRTIRILFKAEGVWYARVDDDLAELDPKTLEATPLFPLPQYVYPAFLRDGYFYATTPSGVSRWDMEGNLEVLAPADHLLWVVDMGDSIAWLSYDEIELLSDGGGEPQPWATLPADTNFVPPAVYDDHLYVAVASGDLIEEGWDIIEVLRDGTSAAITSRPVEHYSISQVGPHLSFQAGYFSGQDPLIQQLDLEDKCYRESKTLEYPSQALTFSTDGRTFMTDSQEPASCLYEVVTFGEAGAGGAGGAGGSTAD